MTNLLTENPHALSPELFCTFMTQDKKATENILTIMVPQAVEILSFSTGAVRKDIVSEFMPFVKIDAILDSKKKGEIYLTCLNEKNSLREEEIINWLIKKARRNKKAYPIVIILDESDNYVYEMESKPVEISSVRDSVHGDFTWTMVNLLSNEYPPGIASIISDLKETDESKFQTQFMRTLYHNAYQINNPRDKSRGM